MPLIAPPESPHLAAIRAVKAGRSVALAHGLTPALTRVYLREVWREAYAAAAMHHGWDTAPLVLTGEPPSDIVTNS